MHNNGVFGVCKHCNLRDLQSIVWPLLPAYERMMFQTQIGIDMFSAARDKSNALHCILNYHHNHRLHHLLTPLLNDLALKHRPTLA